MRFDERKIRSLVKKCFCVLEWCEKFNFSYYENFSHFTHFDEMKILRNSITILSTLKNLTQTLTLSLSSCSPMPKCAMRSKGSKMRVYIGDIDEGKLKSHQINGSLSLGNIIVHLPLPQLMPHFGTLHWWMDNFGLPYRIELKLT